MIFISCTPKEKSESNTSVTQEPVIIDVATAKESSTPLKLSEIAESVSYIRLSDDPLLRDIKTSRLKIIEDTIYLDMDNRGNIYKPKIPASL